jgi:hypothetical protein
MDKKAIALGGLSALLLAGTSGGQAEAQQKLIAPSINSPKITVSPSPNNAHGIDTQRSKSINQASPAAVNRLNKVGAESVPWIEHWAQAHNSATNPIGNVQKTLKQQ